MPRSLRSCVVYKFTCAGYNSVYSMLANRADTPQLEFASIFLQIKIHMYLNIYNAPKPVKFPVMTSVLKLSIQLKHITNLKLRRLGTSYGRDLP